MPSRFRIRLAEGVHAEVEDTAQATAVEVIAAVSTAGRLGDGPFWLVDGDRSLQPGDGVRPGSGGLALHPPDRVKQSMKSLPSGPAVQVGSLAVKFVGASAAPAPPPASDDFQIRIVSTKGGPSKAPPAPPPGVTLGPSDVQPRQGISCVGCGAAVSEADVQCRGCSTTVRGATFAEEVPFPSSRQVAVPKICCCCLRGADRVEREKCMTEMRGNARHYLYVPMPWCRDCWSHHSWSERFSFLSLAVSVGLGIGAGILIDKAGMNGWVTFLGGVGVLVLSVFGFTALMGTRKSYNLPGHVQYCKGIHGVRSDYKSPPSYRLVLGNKQFARQWRALNPE